MGLGCWYELIYAIAVANVMFVFVLIALYYLIVKKFRVVQKVSTLGFISLVILGFGFIVSEFLIDYFDGYSCEKNEIIATWTMFISIAIIVFLFITLRKKEYVFGRIFDRILMILFTVLVSATLYIIVTGDDAEDIIMLLLLGPMEIVFRLVNQ